MLSAYIRLAEVGIGCEPWPECYAQLDVDREKKGITVLTAQGEGMAYKGARIAHRYIASILGIFIVAIFVMALRRGTERNTGLWIPTAIFVITVFLSLLGYYTPTRSNPLITMGNLLGGLSLLALLWWLMQRETDVIAVNPANRFRPLAIGALCLVSLQIVLGGWGSANYASSSCPGLFSCEQDILALELAADAFDPMRTVELDSRGQVVREASLGLISMTHRLFALMTAGYLAWLVRRLKSTNSVPITALLAMSMFSIGQIVVGVSAIWLTLPLLLVTLHNVLAAGLLVSSVNLLHQLTPSAGSRPPG